MAGGQNFEQEAKKPAHDDMSRENKWGDGYGGVK